MPNRKTRLAELAERIVSIQAKATRENVATLKPAEEKLLGHWVERGEGEHDAEDAMMHVMAGWSQIVMARAAKRTRA